MWKKMWHQGLWLEHEDFQVNGKNIQWIFPTCCPHRSWPSLFSSHVYPWYEWEYLTLWTATEKGEWIVNSWLAWHQYDEFSLGICTSFSSYDLSSRMISCSTLRLLFLLNVLQVKRHFRVRRAMWLHIINQTKERSHFMSKMCDRKIKFLSFTAMHSWCCSLIWRMLQRGEVWHIARNYDK